MKRVLVVRSDLMLVAGVESLLAREKDLELAGVSLNDESDLFDVFDKFKPEVVIVEESSGHTHLTRILRFLTNSLEMRFEMRLILIRIRENFIYLIQRQEIPVSGVEDLVAVIRGETPNFIHQNSIDRTWGQWD